MEISAIYCFRLFKISQYIVCNFYFPTVPFYVIHGNETITNVAMNAGFESQRTFNRVFRERFRKSPREDRNYMKNFSGKEEKEVNK